MEPRHRSCWLKFVITSLFYLSIILGLSWVFRVIFNWKIKECELEVKKTIYAEARSDDFQESMEQADTGRHGTGRVSAGTNGITNEAFETLSFHNLEVPPDTQQQENTAVQPRLSGNVYYYNR